MKRIETIKKALRKNIGKKVMLRCVKGRKRYILTDCIIENVYPGIFVLRVHDPLFHEDRMMSYSYCDILTNTIELRLYREENAS